MLLPFGVSLKGLKEKIDLFVVDVCSVAEGLRSLLATSCGFLPIGSASSCATCCRGCANKVSFCAVCSLALWLATGASVDAFDRAPAGFSPACRLHTFITAVSASAWAIALARSSRACGGSDPRARSCSSLSSVIWFGDMRSGRSERRHRSMARVATLSSKVLSAICGQCVSTRERHIARSLQKRESQPHSTLPRGPRHQLR